jgi:hypothetical protein
MTVVVYSDRSWLSRLVRKFGDVLPTTASPAIPMPDVVMHHGAIILTHGEHGGAGGG